MKYKIDKIRERSHVENGVTVQIMRIFFSVSELQYRGFIDMPKNVFDANEARKRIREHVKNMQELTTEIGTEIE